MSDSEIQWLRTALALTREHNRQLLEDNQRLRTRLGLPPAVQTMSAPAPQPREVIPPRATTRGTLGAPVMVRVHPTLMPPPPPPPNAPKLRRGAPPPYRGDKPLRTLWPLEGHNT